MPLGTFCRGTFTFLSWGWEFIILMILPVGTAILGTTVKTALFYMVGTLAACAVQYICLLYTSDAADE